MVEGSNYSKNLAPVVRETTEVRKRRVSLETRKLGRRIGCDLGYAFLKRLDFNLEKKTSRVISRGA